MSACEVGRQLMNSRAAFGLSILMSLLASIVFAFLFARPWLRNLDTQQALIWLVAHICFCALSGSVFWCRELFPERCRKRGQYRRVTVTSLLGSLQSLPRRHWRALPVGRLRRCGSSIFGVWPIYCSHFIKVHALIWSLALWALGSTS